MPPRYTNVSDQVSDAVLAALLEMFMTRATAPPSLIRDVLARFELVIEVGDLRELERTWEMDGQTFTFITLEQFMGTVLPIVRRDIRNGIQLRGELALLQGSRSSLGHLLGTRFEEIMLFGQDSESSPPPMTDSPIEDDEDGEDDRRDPPADSESAQVVVSLELSDSPTAVPQPTTVFSSVESHGSSDSD